MKVNLMRERQRQRERESDKETEKLDCNIIKQKQNRQINENVDKRRTEKSLIKKKTFSKQNI